MDAHDASSLGVRIVWYIRSEWLFYLLYPGHLLAIWLVRGMLP